MKSSGVTTNTYGDQEKTGKKSLIISTLEVSVGMGQSRLLILFFI